MAFCAASLFGHAAFADDNSQQSAAAAELFRKINDFFNPILKWVSTMDNSDKSETSEVQVLTKLG